MVSENTNTAPRFVIDIGQIHIITQYQVEFIQLY